MTEHWTERAVNAPYKRRRLVNHPLVGLVAEGDQGELCLPSWSREKRTREGGWWDRALNLRNPLHWLPYLRSRLSNALVMVEPYA